MAIRIPTDPVGGWSAIHELEIYDILQIWDYEMASNHGFTVFFCILVGGLEHFLFSIIYGIILPIDFHIFQRGRSTTNQVYYLIMIQKEGVLWDGRAADPGDPVDRFLTLPGKIGRCW